MKKIAFFISIILLLNSCENVQRGGCTDPLAINFETSADFDDGSCLYVQGCTDPAAQNYDPLAVVEPVNACLYTTNLVYYLDYSASQYMINWGISFYSFYDNFNNFIGDLSSDHYWTSPPNCLPRNDGATLTTTLEWNGNSTNNSATFTWSAYPDDGLDADYEYTEIVFPNECVKLGLSKKKIQEFKQSK